MLGLFGFLKKNLELQGKLPAKWKESTGFYDASGNIITDKNSKLAYVLTPPNESPNVDMTKAFSVQARSDCASSTTTNFAVGIFSDENWVAIQAVRGGGGSSDSPRIKSRILQSEAGILSNTSFNWVNKSLWLKMEWSPVTSSWTSYYAVSTSEPTAWTKHYAFAKNVGSQIAKIQLLGYVADNGVDLTSVKVISGTSIILDGSSL